MTDRDRIRLVGVHPLLAKRVERILAVMEVAGHPMQVISGLRTDEEQQKLYAQGRTAPGKKVTNADGVRNRSNHQKNLTTGYGHAVDCAFIDDPATPHNETWDERKPWQLYGVVAETFGLSWGGRWLSPVDKPHIELRDITHVV